MSHDYDLLVIGGGSAGYNGAVTACGLGLRVGVVEAARELGGLCILRGCMPSKTLLESAGRYLTLRRAKEFGLRAEGIGIALDEIRARKERLIGEFADYRARQLSSGRFDLIRGRATFVDPYTVEITSPEEETRRLRARSFLLATGSHSKKVPVPGLEETGYWDSDAVLELRSLPRSVIVLGGGATAVEFAHFYAALGVEVTIIQRGRHLLKAMDVDVSQALEEACRRHGMTLHCHTELLRVERTPEGRKRVFFRQLSEVRSVEAEEIIHALGREPNTAGLRLENTGAALTQGRLHVKATQQTSVPHLFAAGDVAGPYEIVHIAIAQAEVAVRNACRRMERVPEQDCRLEEIDYRLRLSVVFGFPEVASVGLTEKELQHAKIAYQVACYPFNDHGKALVAGEEEGFVKLLVSEESREIIGAAVVGAHASELIHEIVVAMRFGATAADLLAIPHYHPTLSEIWTYPAEELVSGQS